MKRLDVALLDILVVLAEQSQILPVLNTQTISECRPGESPATHECYDPSLP